MSLYCFDGSSGIVLGLVGSLLLLDDVINEKGGGGERRACFPLLSRLFLLFEEEVNIIGAGERIGEGDGEVGREEVDVEA